MPCRSSRHLPLPPYNNRSTGFALVISLTLMAFLMLVLVSLSTLLRTETASTEQSRYQTEAELNALLGLKVAVAELQKLTGPDQRVTAPANIDAAAANGKRFWTGAWNSGRTGGVTANDFLGWLVSLPPGTANTLALRETDDIQWETNSNNWVTLVGEGSVESTTNENYVAAGKVRIGDSGHYAYWSGEENTKARVNLNVSETIAATTPDLMAPRYTGFTVIDSDFGSIVPSEGRLSHLNSLSDLSNVTGIASNSLDTRYFHDLSTYGRGVQADAKNGGLKKDLTHLLENNTAFTRYFGVGSSASPLGSWPVPYTFHDADDSYTFPNGAPNWGILGSYYRLYHSVDNGALSPIAPLDVKKSTSVNNYHSSQEIYQYNQPIHAILSSFRLTIALEYHKEGKVDASGNPVTVTNPDGSQSQTQVYRPILHLKPLIALYNPYDVVLKKNQYDINWEFKPFITIKNENGSVTFNLQEVLPEADKSGSMFRWRIEQDTDLQPGETRYYALNKTYEMSNRATNYYFGQMEADWNEAGAYTINLTEWYRGNTDVDEDKRFIVVADNDGNTTSPYSNKSNRESDNDKKSSRFGLTKNERDILRLETTTPNPIIDVNINYDPKNAPSSEPTSTPIGAIYVKTATGTASKTTTQLMDAYFQETEASMRPQPKNWASDMSNLVDNPTDITAVGFSLRAATQTGTPHRQLVDANPRALMLSTKIDGFRAGDGLPSISGWTMTEYNIGASLEPNYSNLDRRSGYWGNTREAASGTASGGTNVVLYHVPREPLKSLGTFQHANLGRYSYQPAYIFGNSYAISKIPSTATRSTYEEYTRTRYAYDWSYALNGEVWDQYFFSTLPQDETEAKELFDEIEAGTDTLPNPRLSLYNPAGYQLNHTDLATLLTDDSEDDTAEITAAFSLTEGMFNVNSTSVAAWKAFLASNSNLDVPIYTPSTNISNTSTAEADTIFFRSPLPYTAGGFNSGGTGQAFWDSYRKLSTDELTDLATAIVAEVRARGPFSSLGDFINRRPGSSDPDQRRRGPLQAALDLTVNSGLATGLVGERGNALKIPDFPADVYNATDTTGTGMPGWILQGDILQALGPLISVRSDTFRIRAYGDKVNPLTGQVVARAWCEAVVQRLPDPVMTNGATPSRTELNTPPSEFGRKYNIISFRWLNKDDV